jgi:transglutaminase-like putative cysteine protease
VIDYGYVFQIDYLPDTTTVDIEGRWALRQLRYRWKPYRTGGYTPLDAPVALSRFVLELPAGWKALSSWRRADGPAPAVSGSTYPWELRDLAALDDEPLAIPEADLAPRLTVALQPPAGSKTPPAFATWAELGRWHLELSRGRDAVTPGMEAQARQIAPAGAAWLDRVRATARFVRDRVRYVAKEIGIGGYQPHHASETVGRLYGDCKDKATLFRALLSAQKIPSFAVPVNLGEAGTVADDVPSMLSFNHVIAACRCRPKRSSRRNLPARSSTPARSADCSSSTRPPRT